MDYATRTYIGYKVYDRKTKEVRLAKQVKQLQVQIIELTLNSMNNVTNPPTFIPLLIPNYFTSPPINPWVQNISQLLSSLNRPYKQNNNNNNNSNQEN